MNSLLPTPSAHTSDNRQLVPALAHAVPSARSTPGLYTREILISTGDLSRSIDVAALLDSFAEANRALGQAAYSLRVVSEGPRTAVQTTCGLTLNGIDASIGAVRSIDTLIVISPDETLRGSLDPTYLRWLRAQHARSRRLVGIAGGTIALAAAGLLDGRRAAIHWTLQKTLKSFPKVLLESDVLYTQDHNVYTCAGAVASIDLALRLIEDDLGSSIAGRVASRMLLHFRRPGDSRQISQTLRAQTASTSPVSRLLAWLPDNLSADLSVRCLAKYAAMSPRNFARVFRQQLGTTPARYVENLRFEAAQRELKNPHQTVAMAAERSGLGSTETMRRLFLRRLGQTPGSFRKQQPT